MLCEVKAVDLKEKQKVLEKLCQLFVMILGSKVPWIASKDLYQYWWWKTTEKNVFKDIASDYTEFSIVFWCCGGSGMKGICCFVLILTEKWEIIVRFLLFAAQSKKRKPY